MIRFVVTFCFLSLLIAACGDDDAGKSKVTGTSPSKQDTVPDFAAADSVEIYFYPDPNETKVFTMAASSDAGFIRLLTRDLVAGEASISECPHPVKFYLFQQGNVFKTVYLSDSCRYLAFSVNGEQYFRPLSDSLLNEVRKIRASAKTP